MSNLAQHIPTFNPTASAKQCFCGLLLPQEARPILQPDPKWKLGEQMSQQDRPFISTARKIKFLFVSWATKRKSSTQRYWVILAWDNHGIYHGVSWLYLSPFLANRNIIPAVGFSIPQSYNPPLHHCYSWVYMDRPIRTLHSTYRARSHHQQEWSMPCESLML